MNEYLHYLGPSFHLLTEPLQLVCGVKVPAQLRWVVEEGK